MWQHNFDIRFTRSVTVSSLGTATIDVNNSNENVILVGMNAVGNGIPIDTVVDEVDCSGTFCRVVFSNNVWLNNGQDVDFSIARNNFYNMNHYSMVKTLFNKDQGNVKRFKTLNYEGSQSKVIYLDPVDDMTSNFTLHDWLGNAYNDASIQMMRDNYPKKGWYAHNLLTDLQTGSIKEFVDKEHKWFNYIKGQEGGGTGDILDTGDFSLQGLGIPGDEGPESRGANSNDNSTNVIRSWARRIFWCVRRVL